MMLTQRCPLYRLKKLVGMHISQLEAIELKPEDVQAHMPKWLPQGYDRFETRHRRKDGHEIDIEVSTTFIGESQWLFVFLPADISERQAGRGRRC